MLSEFNHGVVLLYHEGKAEGIVYIIILSVCRVVANDHVGLLFNLADLYNTT